MHESIGMYVNIHQKNYDKMLMNYIFISWHGAIVEKKKSFNYSYTKDNPLILQFCNFVFYSDLQEDYYSRRSACYNEKKWSYQLRDEMEFIYIQKGAV